MVEENSCEYDSLHFYVLCYVMLCYDFLLDVEFSSLFCEQTTQDRCEKEIKLSQVCLHMSLRSLENKVETCTRERLWVSEMA